MIAKLGVINISNLMKLISCIIKVDFARNKRNVFFPNIRNINLDTFNYCNNTYIKRDKYKIVMESILINISRF